MIIFLDFDGVLHPEYVPGAAPGKYKTNLDYFSCLPNFEKILKEFPDVDVVISSSWCERQSLTDLQAFLSPDLRHRIIGTTPKLQQTESRRQ